MLEDSCDRCDNFKRCRICTTVRIALITVPILAGITLGMLLAQ